MHIHILCCLYVSLNVCMNVSIKDKTKSFGCFFKNMHFFMYMYKIAICIYLLIWLNSFDYYYY